MIHLSAFILMFVGYTLLNYTIDGLTPPPQLGIKLLAHSIVHGFMYAAVTFVLLGAYHISGNLEEAYRSGQERVK